MTHFDLVILGTGSGNSVATADFRDKRVAIIEGGTFGGTCLNVGCIPTKMFVYAAEVATDIRDSARYGVDSTLDKVRWRDIRDRIFGRIDPISAAGKDYRVNGSNTTAYLGQARFTGSRELQVDVDGRKEQVDGDQVVIAAGSHAVIPPVVSNSGVPYHTSDTVMRIDDLPEHLVIIGGGFIAAEFSHVFSALGSKVSVIARQDLLLSRLDTGLATAYTEQAAEQWDLHMGVTATSVEGSSGEVRVGMSDGRSLRGDLLMVCAGRHPSTADIGLDLAGVRVRDDGRVQVDEYGRTTAEGVWALGDVSSPWQLKHVANHEARVVAHNLTHPQELQAFDHRFVPQAVFTRPQIAAVGATEEQLQQRDRRYVAHTQKYGDTAYGWAMEDQVGICKVLADPATGELLGAHVLGYQASTLIQPLIQAMSFGQKAYDVARGQYWIHPALAEVIENALLGLELDDGAKRLSRR